MLKTMTATRPKPLRQPEATGLGVWAKWAGLQLVCGLAAGWFFGAGALERSELLPSLQAEIKASPVIKNLPTPAFSWTIEKQRTGRDLRSLKQQFSASADGLASHQVTETRDGKTTTRALISLRGLMDVDADDSSFGLQLNGLTLPVEPGNGFRFVLRREGRNINKECKTLERKTAKSLHKDLPGQLVPIVCDARGTYLGFEIKSSSELVWIEALHLFLPLAERANTPLGTFSETSKLGDFSLTKD